jgi:hypothetical protein
LLNSLIAISTSSLVGSLPSPLPNPQRSSETEGAASATTIDDLVQYAETRANLEFNRKEAVRTSAQTVLDVLMKR